MKATKQAHDWHCHNHDTYGWRGDECKQCSVTPSEVEQLVFRNERLVADYAELQGLNENHAFNAKYFKAENEALKQQVEQGKLDAVPEGWVAIPIIPTDKQIRAMEDQWMRGSNIDMAMREYRAAIAAAPKQEK